jgi:DNA-binding transcriptional ArsR family regulator
MSTRRAGAAPAATSLSRLRALADPLRYRIFENLIAEPRTARQMAQHLGTHLTRLYHHFHVLEKAGLIRAAGTRQKRGTVEKYFKAAVDRIETGGGSAGPARSLVPALLEGVLGSTLADMRLAGTPRNMKSRRTQTYVKRYLIRATPELAAEIHARLEAVAALCERAPANEGEKEFAVTLAFYESPDMTTRRRKK